MLIPTPILQNFIEVVPLCWPSTRLSAVRLIFRRGKWDYVVVVNELQQPLGLVYLSRLFQKRLFSKGRVRHSGELLSTVQPTIVEPLILVSADLGLNEFGLWLQEQEATTLLKNQEKNTQFNDLAGSSENWSRHLPVAFMSPKPKSAPIALIEPSSGKFLGLLDSLRLLKFMAIEGLHKKEVGVRNLALSKAENPLPNSQLPSSNYQLPIANSFVQLLEQLPLPLRLLDTQGQIITSNAAWKSLLGDGPELTASATPTANSSPQPFSYRDAGNSLISGTPTPEGSSRFLVSEVQQWEGAISGSICAIALETKKSANSSVPSWCGLAEPAENVATSPDIYTSPTNQGSDRIWQFVKQPISETLTLVLAQDVTEEQLIAKELAAKNTDLIQLNRLKDEFLACISHELKTPLTAVLGLSSLLKDHAIGELNDRQTRYAKLIHASGRHLMRVVNDILDLTRIETGQMELSVEPVQIATVCDRAFEGASLLQQQEDKPPNTDDISGNLPKSQIDFTLEIEPGLAHIVADELRLRQMLVNLLSNALKFTDEGGKIGLKVNHWEGWIAFTVWDTGIGIPADKQHLIFQKFQQLESPLTRRFQGTGLGLVLTQRLARLHGGDVSFISSEGQGSQFTLLLPMEEGARDWKSGTKERAEENFSLVSEACFQTSQSDSDPPKSPLKRGTLSESSPPPKSPLERETLSESSPPPKSPLERETLSESSPASKSPLKRGTLSESSPPSKSPLERETLSESSPASKSPLKRETLSESSPPSKSPLKRETLSELSPLKKGIWEESPGLKTDPSPYPVIPSSRLVLIVETVPQFIEDLTNLLTGLGYRVLIARSGTEALEKARRFHPEVIFLNPLLPLLSGWDVLTLLKNDAETSSIPAIITATRGEKERATLNRAEGFLSLPVKESALLGQLQKLLPQSKIKAVDLPNNSLTVLLLSPLNTSFHAASFLIHPSYCRVLEADDLDQAELLARIWHPNVMVLESVSEFENMKAFVEELSRRSSLTAIPLVTLDPITTQLANQVKGLSVFPCLAPSDRSTEEDPNTSGLMASALWQVIQAAIALFL